MLEWCYGVITELLKPGDSITDMVVTPINGLSIRHIQFKVIRSTKMVISVISNITFSPSTDRSSPLQKKPNKCAEPFQITLNASYRGWKSSLMACKVPSHDSRRGSSSSFRSVRWHEVWPRGIFASGCDGAEHCHARWERQRTPYTI
jgi:hypothetical protein